MAALIVLPSSLFTAYQTPDDPPAAAKEALLQLNLVMGQMKVLHEASQIAFNVGGALQANVQVSRFSDRPYFLTDHLLGCDCFEIVCLLVRIQAESLH